VSDQLIIGFGFSLMPDGSPGTYNRELAHRILRDVKDNDVASLIAVQWEIADALWDIEPERMAMWESQSRLLVVQPPRISPADVREERLTEYLNANLSPFCSILSKEMSNHLVKTVNEDAAQVNDKLLDTLLDTLLDEPMFFKKFTGLDLVNLDRPELGRLFGEIRVLPRDEEYPKGLRRFQRVRINRLVMESIIQDDSCLQRGQYLSTTDVIHAALDHCCKVGFSIVKVRVVAHSEHVSRCLQQTREVLLSRSPTLHPQLNSVHADAEIPWDKNTAQVWCRSLSNWKKYEAKVQKWMKGKRSVR
jgi:hypothetical protein